ncbi:hypothetical protein MIH18_16820 [Marinobacter sp. M3C]|jgi:hypothetical protein|uniref:hypothetical protein n=1 Tax=Marinobacter sp. M3C TaxID=2917715 RepID=UPI00200CFB62|nr:hypothetical protein [Marinobacter sp. M3C]UQG59375.1 hypothetical protein MIH18_16820 [Marinobacter sp. M3C]
MLLRLFVFTLVIMGAACSNHSQQAHAQESNAVTVNLAADAIEAAILSEGAIWLKLTPSGSHQLATTTKDNLGNRVMVHVLGYKALSLMVVHEIASDRLVIKSPSPELKAAIEPYLAKTR